MNAVLNPERLETIFDHAISDDEMRSLCCGDTESFEEYTGHLTQDSAYSDIARLYQLRHNTTKADVYIAKINNKTLKTQMITRPCCAMEHSSAVS